MAETRLYAVCGSPILHSKSPFMFNAQFASFKQPAVYSRISTSSSEEALFLYNELGLSGMNITAPLKQEVLATLADADTTSHQIGGVNVITGGAGKLEGYNTDHLGVTVSLKQREIPLQNRKAIVLGAGTAGRAAVYGLLQNGVEVILVNRTFSKAQAAAQALGCRAHPWGDLRSLLETVPILISAVSAPWTPVPKEWLRSELVVFDAKYPHSPLCEDAAAQGCTVLRGEEWLLNQALPVFKMFTGQDAEESLMRQALSTKTYREAKPGNIALIGFMGCGKTTIGKKLASRLGYDFQDTDSLIEEQEARSIPEIFHEEGEAYFRRAEKRAFDALKDKKGYVWACGGGSVMDSANREILQHNSLVIWLYTSLGTSFARIERGTRPLLEGDAPRETAAALLESRLPAYAQASDMIICSEKDTQDIVERIYAEIG
jgi:shikimate dehydrogenase